tara:strand:+ start:65 stop:238 length:174 start_codon:yes stop_codon:yes gene_type:complete
MSVSVSKEWSGVNVIVGFLKATGCRISRTPGDVLENLLQIPLSVLPNAYSMFETPEI